MQPSTWKAVVVDRIIIIIIYSHSNSVGHTLTYIHTALYGSWLCCSIFIIFLSLSITTMHKILTCSSSYHEASSAAPSWVRNSLQSANQTKMKITKNKNLTVEFKFERREARDRKSYYKTNDKEKMTMTTCRSPIYHLKATVDLIWVGFWKFGLSFPLSLFLSALSAGNSNNVFAGKPTNHLHSPPI